MMTWPVQPLLLEIAAVIRSFDNQAIPIYSVYASLRIAEEIPNYSDARRTTLHPRYKDQDVRPSKHPMTCAVRLFDNRNIVWGNLTGKKLEARAKEVYVWKNAHNSDNWGLSIGLAPTEEGVDIVEFASWLPGNSRPDRATTFLMIAALNANKHLIVPNIVDLKPGETWYGEHFVRTQDSHIPAYTARSDGTLV